jgi:hypothetical protein
VIDLAVDHRRSDAWGMGLFSDWAKSRRMTDPVRGTLQVTACSTINAGTTSANYNLDGVVTAEGIEPTAVNHDGMAKASKWPYGGRSLPITIDRADPTSFRIEWAEVPTGNDLGKASAQALAARLRAGR